MKVSVLVMLFGAISAIRLVDYETGDDEISPAAEKLLEKEIDTKLTSSIKINAGDDIPVLAEDAAKGIYST